MFQLCLVDINKASLFVLLVYIWHFKHGLHTCTGQTNHNPPNMKFFLSYTILERCIKVFIQTNTNALSLPFGDHVSLLIRYLCKVSIFWSYQCYYDLCYTHHVVFEEVKVFVSKVKEDGVEVIRYDVIIRFAFKHVTCLFWPTFVKFVVLVIIFVHIVIWKKKKEFDI
mgnify:CR=1 FL=1